jgi:DNA-binding CsgD family transcriptional regulator
MKAFLRKYRHQHIFTTSDINPISRFDQWISLYRADKTKRCRAEEAELLASLAPHMMQALAINRLMHLDRLTGEDAREKWSVAIADQRGILYHADLRFRELVKVRRWMGTEDRIPEDMLAPLLGGEAQIYFGNTVVRHSMERGLLFLKARERTAVDDLTSRELLVASLLVSGLTHKEVALKLDRSPETIRSQMKSIFEKLGVNKLAMLGPMLATRE